MSWPEYAEPTPIGGGLGWTATFDSYDQYRDDIYYLVTVAGGGAAPRSFMVQVWAAETLTGTALRDHLRTEIGRIARTGATNTSYSG